MTFVPKSPSVSQRQHSLASGGPGAGFPPMPPLGRGAAHACYVSTNQLAHNRRAIRKEQFRAAVDIVQPPLPTRTIMQIFQSVRRALRRDAELQETLNSFVRDSLRPLATGMTALFGMWTVKHALEFPRPDAVWMGGLAGATALIMLGVRMALKAFTVPTQWAHSLVGMLSILLLANCVVPVLVGPQASQTTDFILLVIGVGCVVLSVRWQLLIVGATVLSWFGLSWTLSSEPAWNDFLFAILSASIVSTAILVARIRFFTGFAWLQRQSVRRQELAEAASRAKSEFLTNMSHEIRTPMTVILGFADMLEEHVSGANNVDAVRAIKRNGEYLLALINDILDLSKIESGRIAVDSVHCSPRDILRDVAALMQVRAEEKELSLTFECGGPIPEFIHSDPVRLRQILIHVIGNAVKFTEVGGIHVVTRLAGEHTGSPRLHVEVIDTGIGISESQIAQIFQPFTQADASTTRAFGGTGMGLAICHRLCRLLGGDIRVTSTPGEGSAFTVTVATGPLKGVRLLEDDDEDNWLAPSAPEENVVHDAPSLAGCRVLLAEDSPDTQQFIIFMLRKAGADVVLAENGRIAVDKALIAAANGRPFDAILMDMQMPVVDGYAATRELRRCGYERPILALTAHAMKHDRDRCLQAGCNDFLAKPVRRRDLLHLIFSHTCGVPARRHAKPRTIPAC